MRGWRVSPIQTDHLRLVRRQTRLHAQAAPRRRLAHVSESSRVQRQERQATKCNPMSKPIRAFIAIKLASPPSLSVVITKLDVIGRPVKAVHADRLHVTLKFLGDISPELISQLGDAIRGIANAHSAFNLRIRGLGAFPNVRRPTVVWAGLENGETLVNMAAELDKRLKPLGISQERRKYQPHLTLARVRSKPPAELAALLDELATEDFGVVSIDSLELMQSDLGPEGPRYTTLAKSELTGPSAPGN